MLSSTTGLQAIAFVASICGIIIFNTSIFAPEHWIWGVYPLTASLMIIALAALGIALKGRPAGVVIDARNSISLSKLQMIAWTVVVVSGLATGAAYNVRNGLSPMVASQDCKAVDPAARPAGCVKGAAPGGPLEIVIPAELLAAMGIAAASFVSTPTILSIKAGQPATPQDMAKAEANAVVGSVNNALPKLEPNGKVYTRVNSADAEWSDIFMGDEVGNGDGLDLSKIQQFAITLLLLGVYSAQIIEYFRSLVGAPQCVGGACQAFSALPSLGAQFVVLMGISHASYLVYKAAPLTKTGEVAG